jgi:hypothetical protein
MKKVIYVKFEVAVESYQEAENKVKEALSDPGSEKSKKIISTYQIVNKVHM